MTIVQRIKKRFYFVAAGYFRFFTKRVLRRWHPRIIAVTGSVGKTTMLHLIEAELGSKAHYSHDANSAFGISFDLVGVRGVTGSKLRWLYLVFAVPIRSLYYRHSEQFYVVEIDGERPHEAEFLAEWLQPEVTIWVSLGLSHAVQFEQVVASGQFATLEDAITHEFSTIPAHTQRYVYIDGDDPRMVAATSGIQAKVVPFHRSDLQRYTVYPSRTDFYFDGATFHFSQPQPRDLTMQLLMLMRLVKYLKLPLRTDLSSMPVPPGRSSYFDGINGLKLIDSSYNAHLVSMESILDMAARMRTGHKWLIIGDMVEQGSIEGEEHAKLADLIAKAHPEEVILIGRRTKQYTAPRLRELGVSVRTTIDPEKALKYLKRQTSGQETLIFKGSQYLEWIIEKLLKDPADAARLPRREPAAVRRRAKRGLT